MNAKTHERMTEAGVCPRCGDGDLWRDSVDVGVGVIYGPYACPCGWSESEEYDALFGKGCQIDEKGGYTDPYGGYWPAGNPVAKMMREKIHD